VIAVTTASDPHLDRRRLRIYLSDHRAGAVGGVSLARRSARRNRGSPLGHELQALVHDIAADARALDRACRAFGIRTSVVKRMLAAAGEQLGRLKPNGQLRGYSPLSRLLEVEALLAGIDAKRSLWLALSEIGAGDMLAAAGVELERLAKRAEDQRQRLGAHHPVAARRAFAGEAPAL
jgi:hypothetical protein